MCVKQLLVGPVVGVAGRVEEVTEFVRGLVEHEVNALRAVVECLQSKWHQLVPLKPGVAFVRLPQRFFRQGKQVVRRQLLNRDGFIKLKRCHLSELGSLAVIIWRKISENRYSYKLKLRVVNVELKLKQMLFNLLQLLV